MGLQVETLVMYSRKIIFQRSSSGLRKCTNKLNSLIFLLTWDTKIEQYNHYQYMGG